MSSARAVTIRGQGSLLGAIISPIGISAPFIGEPVADLKTITCKAVWDTGASGSVITKKAADELGLIATGQKEIHTANGIATKNTYLVNITLPGDVMIQHVKVTEADLVSIDALIGMDIITLGDFSITNKGGITVMSFRIPSLVEIDYVHETRMEIMNRHDKRAYQKQNNLK